MFELIDQTTLAEYEAFVQGHPRGHFMQSVLWSAQKPQWTWRAVGVRGSDGRLKGTLAVMIRPVPLLGRTLMYGCRGPVCDPADRETFAALLEGAKALAREYKSYVIKLDPDISAENTGFARMLADFSFRFAGAGQNFEAIQPKFVMRLALEGRTEAEVLARFHPKWRYNLRLAQRRGVEVRVCGKEMVPAFGALMEVTALRDGFVPRQPEYFAALLEHLGSHARLYMAFWEGQAIAGAVAVQYGDKTWYLYGASANEHREKMPNYLLQWEMIRWAIEGGCRLYDFRGVSGDLSEKNPLYGLYRFKKGFGSALTEFVGEADLVLNRPVYGLIRAGSGLWRKLRRRLWLRSHDGGKEISRK